MQESASAFDAEAVANTTDVNAVEELVEESKERAKANKVRRFLLKDSLLRYLLPYQTRTRDSSCMPNFEVSIPNQSPKAATGKFINLMYLGGNSDGNAPGQSTHHGNPSPSEFQRYSPCSKLWAIDLVFGPALTASSSHECHPKRKPNLPGRPRKAK